MGKVDQQYHSLLKAVKEGGYVYRTANRPSVDCHEIASATLQIPLTSAPIINTKEVKMKSVVEELLWFLRGDSSLQSLINKGVNIWNKDGYTWYCKECDVAGLRKISFEDFVEQVKTGNFNFDTPYPAFYLGDVGRNYGVQWRDWTHGYRYAGADQVGSFDQITNLIDNLRKPNPISRRHIVTAWNPAEISETALPPCHWAFEVIVSPLTTQQKINYSGKDPVYLETVWNSAVVKKDAEAQELLKQELAHVPEYGFQLKWHQRSCDLFLGIPFNIASYGLLAYILGDLTGLVPLAVIADLSHIHIYAPHMKSVEEQLSRNPMQYESPTLTFSPNYLKASAEFKSSLGLSDHFNEFVNKLSHEDFIFNNYQHFPQLKEDMFAEEN